MKLVSLTLCLFSSMLPVLAWSSSIDYYEDRPFGDDTNWALDADNVAIGEWWNPQDRDKPKEKAMRKWFASMDREEALAFAIYTVDHNVLKLTAQCFPLFPEEPKSAVLEVKKDGHWHPLRVEEVQYPGWSIHFRVENWDSSKDVPYRVRLGRLSSFEGLIRHDPVEKDTIVVASLNCNSPMDKARFSRTELVENLKQHDPDLLFFAGDQNYTHDEATYGWLQFGVQYADIMRDRPTICIPDDHDVGHGNLWGEGGVKSEGTKGAADGGYMYPASFVKMVERLMTWNLPDAFDPTPVKQGIGVYYTDLNVGGISFAILEDRKFKTGPLGEVPEMGPRPDHIRDASYDRKAIDKPGLKLLGDRQLKFLQHWVRDWTDSEMKVALSQTAFCGAVHCHGSRDGRLLADLDCNGWPQTGRNKALTLLRVAQATHLCGDQHLSVVVKHGIEHFRDGPYAFTAPALVNTIYGRWWWPEDEQPGGGEPVASPLPWVGDYEDGLGNKITMLSYANPEYPTMEDIQKNENREDRKDGYGLVRFTKSTGKTVFEAWPRFANLENGDSEQFEGWPITFYAEENDGREVFGWLPKVDLPVENAVVELWNEKTDELVYCHRVKEKTFEAPVFEKGKYTLKAGKDRAEQVVLKHAKAKAKE